MKSGIMSALKGMLAIMVVVALVAFAVPSTVFADTYVGVKDKVGKNGGWGIMHDSQRGAPMFEVMDARQGGTADVVEQYMYEYKKGGEVYWYHVRKPITAEWVGRQGGWMFFSYENQMYKVVTVGGTQQFVPLDGPPVIRVGEKSRYDGGDEVTSLRNFEQVSSSWDSTLFRATRTYDKAISYGAKRTVYEKERYQVQENVTARRDALANKAYFTLGSTRYRFTGFGAPQEMGFLTNDVVEITADQAQWLGGAIELTSERTYEPLAWNYDSRGRTISAMVVQVKRHWVKKGEYVNYTWTTTRKELAPYGDSYDAFFIIIDGDIIVMPAPLTDNPWVRPSNVGNVIIITVPDHLVKERRQAYTPEDDRGVGSKFKPTPAGPSTGTGLPKRPPIEEPKKHNPIPEW
jgi:hypothetical protein